VVSTIPVKIGFLGASVLIVAVTVAGLPSRASLQRVLAAASSAATPAEPTRCDVAAGREADVLWCEDFSGDVRARWDVASRGGLWPSSDFAVCREGFGFRDGCAAWSNYLRFDLSWGFWGYDARRAFPPRSEFYVRWYQYISDPFEWGTLEDKSVMLHDAEETIVAIVGTNRNHLPAIPDSGPGVPWLANYQDLDWGETAERGERFTRVNRFQNQGRNLALQPGRWYLFEWYIKLNTPGLSNGVTRVWIDDAMRPIATQTLRMEHTDMRWLKVADAGKQFGLLRLTLYHQRCDGTPNTCPPHGPETLRQSHRWDQIVVSTSPIGPAPAVAGMPSGTQ
jgi:hypothetical protein